MEAEDPLSQLRDIHLPDAVTFWPPAPGWWMLLVLIIISLVFFYRHAIAAMIQRRKLASVLRELERSYSAFNEQAVYDGKRNQAGLDYLAELNTLLNRVVQSRCPETGAALITGEKWLLYLDSFDNSTEFSQGPGMQLADGIYRRNFDADADALNALAKSWIENRYHEKLQLGPILPGRRSVA